MNNIEIDISMSPCIVLSKFKEYTDERKKIRFYPISFWFRLLRENGRTTCLNITLSFLDLDIGNWKTGMWQGSLFSFHTKWILSHEISFDVLWMKSLVKKLYRKWKRRNDEFIF